MKITRVTVTPFAVPYSAPTLSSNARSDGTNRVLVQVETDDGLLGVGEAPLFQAMLPQLIEEVIVPALLGRNPHEIEPIIQQVERHPHARLYPRAIALALAPAEIALWDLIGKAAGQPVHRLLGGAVRQRVPMAGVVFAGEPQARAQHARELVAQGYRTIKMKVGVDVSQDIAGIRAVRETVGPEVALRVDPNQAWTLGTAKRVMRQIEACDLQYIEQPLRLDDLQGLADLRASIRTPVAVNESAYTPAEVLRVLQYRAADIIRVDPVQAGGLWQAKKICALAEAAALPVTLHTSADTSIGLAAHLHLAASTPNLLYATDTLFYQNADDLVREPLRITEGSCVIPTKPGLGVDLDPEALRRAAARPPVPRDWIRPWL